MYLMEGPGGKKSLLSTLKKGYLCKGFGEYSLFMLV